MSLVHIGLSGYSYKPWRGEGRFYPADLKQDDFLRYYASRYDALEMDGTWYRMPSEAAVQSWLAETPAGFHFCPKAHRDITHIRRLKPEAIQALEFMVKRLEPIAKAGKLGPMLVQLPPNLKRDDDRLAAFLSSAPKGIQYAMEFRHESWHAVEVERILMDNHVAWACVETDESEPQKRDTGPVHYVRLRKTQYDGDALAAWAAYFISTGKPCFVFCKHEDEGSPWIWADELLRLTR
jgi:uncharacterized protein YecE (DUF72 family)